MVKPPDVTTLGGRIAAARRAAGITSQRKLGDRVGVEPATVARWEQNAMVPSDPNLEAVAEALGTSAAWLKYGRESDTPKPAEPDAPTDQDDEIREVAKRLGLTPDQTEDIRGIRRRRGRLPSSLILALAETMAANASRPSAAPPSPATSETRRGPHPEKSRLRLRSV